VNAVQPAQFILGIREPLPDGERVLWQGAPDTLDIAVRVLHVRKVAAYFAVILAMRVAWLMSAGAGLSAAVAASSTLFGLAALACCLMVLYAYAIARTSIYAITNRRIFMRIGVALPIFLNLPFEGVDSADLLVRRGHSGDIALKLTPGTRIAYLHLWPHARPWQLTQPQPMLRCLADVEAVASVLAPALAQAAGSSTQWKPSPAPRTAALPATSVPA
jgi:hypothetical protein